MNGARMGTTKNYYGQSPGADPAGPLGASVRVFRGGGWDGFPRGCAVGVPAAGSRPAYRATPTWGSAWPESSLVVELRSGSGARSGGWRGA